METMDKTILLRLKTKEHANAKRMADKLGLSLSQYIRISLAQQIARDARKD